MNDQDQAGEPSVEEVAQLRRRVAELEAQLARSQQAEADQRKINSSLPVLVATAGVDGYYKEVNTAFERIFGWSEQVSLSRPIWEFVHPDDRAAHDENFERLKSGDPAINFRERHFCKDGSHRWISWTVIPVPDRDIVFGIGHDITKQRQAEDELRRSEARLRSVVDNAPVQVTTVDSAGTILFINRPAPGLKLEDVIGRSVYDFLQPEHCDQGRQCIEHVFRTGEAVVNESMATGPHGTRSWYETRLGPVKIDGQVVAVTLVSTDITERKQAERALQESEERFHKVFEEGPIGVALVDLDTRIRHVNRRFCETLGYSEEEIIELGINGITHPADLELDRRFGMRLLREEVSHYTIEKRYLRKGGQVIWGQLTTSMMHDAAGRPTHIIGMIEDITERKQAAMKLQESEERFRRVFEEGPLGFAMFGPDLRIQRVNQRLCDMLGYSEHEFLELGVAGVTHPDDFEKDRQLVLRSLRDEIPHYTIDKRYGDLPGLSGHEDANHGPFASRTPIRQDTIGWRAPVAGCTTRSCDSIDERCRF